MESAILLGVFLLLAVLGVPLAFAMALSTSFVMMFVLDISLTAFFSRAFAGIDAFSLLAIPFFVLVGELLTGGGMSQRLIDFANSFIGWMRGGLGNVNVGASVLFGGVSGSSAADTAAIGGVMIPQMKRAGYDPGFAAAVTASSATIGSLIPPSVLLIIYGGISGLSIGALFLAGVGPGLAVGVFLFLYTWWRGRKQVGAEVPFSIRNIGRTFVRAGLTGVLPVLLVWGILTGATTATEAGVVGAVYALIIGRFVYRELTWGMIYRMTAKTAELTGALMLLLFTATAFAWVLAFVGLPRLIIEGIFLISDNRTVIVLIVIVFLLIFGMFVETIAAATIIAPVLLPLGAVLGFDPLHFGMILIMTLLVGTVTPPVGILLFICQGIAEIDTRTAVKAIAPFVGVLALVVVLVAFVPALTTWLPSIAAR
jgi:tripartite ATP-independent transporter DctM subunit